VRPREYPSEAGFAGQPGVRVGIAGNTLEGRCSRAARSAYVVAAGRGVAGGRSEVFEFMDKAFGRGPQLMRGGDIELARHRR